MGSRSRSLLAAFLVVIAIPVAALVWLGFQLIEQDRQLNTQRQAERRELAAGRAVSALEKMLSDLERGLREAVPRSPGTALIRMAGGGLEVRPREAVAFYPAAGPLEEAPMEVFQAAEQLEFRQHDLARAIEELRRLAESAREGVRAGALLRLARVLRKAGRTEEALDCYRRLGGLTKAGLEGVPADLIGRRARIATLSGLGRKDEAAQESAALQSDLLRGRWSLDRSAYLHFADAPPDEPRATMSEALRWLWERRGQVPGAGRAVVGSGARSVLIVWRREGTELAALAVPDSVVRREWFEPIEAAGHRITLVSVEGQRIHGPPPAGNGAKTARTAAETGLPWTLVVSDAKGSNEGGTPRRALILTGLAAIMLVLGAGVYFIGRALSREMAVMRLQSDFVAAVSHEFRTPLTSMRQFTELLLQDKEPPAEKRQAFYRAQLRSTERLHRLVESLLDFGRMEAGRHPYQLRHLDAVELIGSTVEDFRSEISPRGFVVEWNAPREPVGIHADPDALSRALWNLLDNAAKYSGDQRWIGVELKRGDGNAFIRVRDRGIGIPLSERPRIFEKFVRGARASEDGIKGTGIGLAMVRHIVTAHQGRIDVESEPGQGSVFTISIPAEE